MSYQQSFTASRRTAAGKTLGFWAAGLLLIASTALCRAQDSSPPGFQAYPLRHAQASDVAPQLSEMLSGPGRGAKVLADGARNRILVQGPEESQRLAMQLLRALDQPPSPPPVRQESKETVEVKGYRVLDGDLDAVAARLQAKYPPSMGVRIAVDGRTRQLIVVAPRDVQQKIARELGTEGAGNPHGPPDLASPMGAKEQDANPSHQLRHITWREFEDELRRIWGSRLGLTTARSGEVATVLMSTAQGPQPILQIDRRQDLVTFTGPDPVRRTWRGIVQALDSPRDDANRQVQVVPLGHADPAQIHTAVSLIRAAGGARDNDNVTTAVRLSDRSNRSRWGGQLVSMIFQQDGQPLGAQAAPPKAPAAATPEAADKQGAAEEGGLIGSVQIEIIGDVIVITGHKRDVERVERIIEDIKRISMETRPAIEVYHLQHVNSQALVDLMTELYEEILAPQVGQVSMRALVEPNAILLIGGEERLTVVKELIGKLDQPAVPSARFEIFRLKHVSAVTAETTVRNFFVNRPGTDTQDRSGLGTRVQILAEYRTNSLIVQASPRDLEEVRRLIQSIDVFEGEATAELRVFKLKNALAQDLATVLQGAISGQVAGAPGQQPGQPPGVAQPGVGATQAQAALPSAVLEFMMVDQEGGRLLRSGILADVQVSADVNLNALLVRAPAKSMELIAALIQALDQLPDAEARIKVFEIVNGDATSLATMLQQLFGQQVTIGQGTGGLFGGALGGFAQPQLQTGAGAGESSLVPLRFSVDTRTNSIIASGSEGDLNVVEVLLLRLDEGDVETRKLAVIRLKNAPAADVANAITQFLTSQRTLIQQQLLFNQAISPFEQIEREIIVVAEAVTNSLIVSATPRYYDEILQVIQDLDFRPPMVMVQVVIAEVVLSDDFEFGVEFGLQDSLLFNRGIAVSSLGTANAQAVPGFNFNDLASTLPNLNSLHRELLAGQALTNFGVGRTRGGLVLSAANESINILVRALQEQGKLQVLSRPQIMTLNNQEAFVQVGADVSRITGTTITQGIVQNNIQDVQTGLILRINPLINDDGVVVMTVDAERSALGSEAEGTVIATDQNGAAIRSAPINRTTAQTTISAKSGQTVVFAGLITKDNSVTLQRVPFLSDIPVLGRLFEFEKRNNSRSELLIIMTPYIVEWDEDYEWIKTLESERMSWCLADVVELHGDVGLQGGSCLFCERNVPLIFPSVDAAAVPYLPSPAAIPEGPAPAPMERSSQHEQLPELAPPATDNMTRREIRPISQAGVPPAATAAGPNGVAPQYKTSVSYGPPPPSFSGGRIDYRVSRNIAGGSAAGGPEPINRLPVVR